jgi:hypothetical protein
MRPGRGVRFPHPGRVVSVRLVRLANRNLFTIIIQLIDTSDPLHKAVREFVK